MSRSRMSGSRLAKALLCTGTVLAALPASAETTLRIGMTASDVPTATGMPNHGFEGMRFLGYPIFEALVMWDLARADQLAGPAARACRALRAAAGRQEDLDLPLASRGQIPPRYRLQRRRGDLESRPLLHQGEPAIRAARRRHFSRAGSAHGGLSQEPNGSNFEEWKDDAFDTAL